nr:hypothetical protein [Tanacetum cinerariifolium]
MLGISFFDRNNGSREISQISCQRGVVTWWSSHFGMTWHTTSMWQITTPWKGPSSLQLAHVELKYMEKVFDGDDIPQCVNHGPQPNYTFRYNFKAVIFDGTGTDYFTFFTPNADILTGIDCPKLFHYSPHCEKGKVDVYFDAILDKPLQIAGSSEQAENITGTPAVEVLEYPRTQASKKETSMEAPKKTSKCLLFPETQDDPKKKKMD